MAPMSQPSSHGVPRHIRTRRHLWLSANPSYFEQASHALSLPLAYDRLIRVYQSSTERQAEGQRQGWAKMLEGALVRGEAKRDKAMSDRRKALRPETEPSVKEEKSPPTTNGRKGLKALPEELDVEDVVPGARASEAGSDAAEHEIVPTSKWDMPLGMMPAEELLELTTDSDSPGPFATAQEESFTGPSQIVVDGLDKAHALSRWQELLGARFVAGDDEDVDYAEIDREGQEMDHRWKEAREQDEWFENEAESWSDDGTERGKKLEGETGVQDF